MKDEHLLALRKFASGLQMRQTLFPRAGMPDLVQKISLVIPLTYFLELLRGVVLKGAGLGLLWRWILPLTGLMIGFFALATYRFRRSFE